MERAAITLHHRLEPEDQARADFYALLARLYADAPDAAAAARRSPRRRRWATTRAGRRGRGGADDLPAAWAMPARRERGDGSGRRSRRVQRPFRRRGQERGQPACVALADRLHDGKAAGRVARHAGASWGSPGAPRRRWSRIISPRCSKRCAFWSPGRRRRAAGRRLPSSAHFSSGISRRGSSACCTAIRESPVANYYRRVAQFTDTFMALERDSFAID